MPRMSIYVPDDMKARLDKAGEGANWSAIAQRAFTVELNHLESIKEISSMSDVVQRLRASKAKFAETAVADGRKCGADWAKHHAEFDELRRIAMVDEDGLDMLTGPDAACHVYEMTTGESISTVGNDRDDLGAFYMVDESAVDAITPEFVAGFVEGATAVWEEVEDAI